MAKGKSTWKYNKLLTARRNYFLTGGPTKVNVNSISPTTLVFHDSIQGNIKPLNTGNTGNKASTEGLIGGIGAIGTQAASDISNLIQNIKGTDITERADNMINGVNAAQADAQSDNDTFDSLTSDWNNFSKIDNVTAKDLGAESFGESFGKAFAAGNAGFAAGSSLGPWGAAGAATGSTITSIIGSIFKNKKAKEEAKRVNEAIDYTNAFNERSLYNRADNLRNNQMQDLLANYAAFGGELNTQGGDFTNGLLAIDAGGSHETNPYEGVPLGVDSEGTPNLVEEGETVFNDYVFSKRLKVPKAIRNKYAIRGTKELTFAEMSKQLAKESEERPNDPISQRGLEDSMFKLMIAQEQVREKKGERQFAKGGHLFKNGSTLRYNNGPIAEDDPLYSLYKDYLTNGRIDFNKLYAADSPWMIKRNAISELLKDRDKSKDFRQWYVDELNKYNSGREGYTPYSADDITSELFDRWSQDKKLGFGHNVISYDDIDRFLDESSTSPRKKAIRRYILGDETDSNGTPLDPYATAQEFTKYDPNSGTYNYVSTRTSSEGDTDYTDYYYRLKPPKEEPKESSVDLEGKTGKYPNYDSWMRYMPLLGASIGLGTTLFTKPDDSNAQAVLDASRTSGTYQPVRFNPIGNYLTYRPFDRDYYINKMNAEAGATRRNVMNTSGGNRATAMAGILAANNNYLNQIGSLGRQAEEYNLAQRNQVEEFNRGTNMTNSQGFLQADLANQKALMNSGELALKGTMAAAEMREADRLAREQAISAGISGIFNTLGDIGRERVDRKWRTWLGENGYYAPVQAAHGGKIKRKKGLTF